MLKKILIILIIVVVMGAIAGFTLLSRNSKNDNAVVSEALKEVSLVSIQSLQEKSMPLPLIGEVTSENEVTIKTEISGKVIGVYAEVGDSVQAGRIIAEIETHPKMQPSYLRKVL